VTASVRRRAFALAACAVLWAAGCGGSDQGGPTTGETTATVGTADAPVTLTYEVVDEHPHDSGAFTQGLLRVGSRFFESTGMYGRSDVRIVDVASGRVLKRHRIPDAQFGEGLTLHEGRLFQLTWKNGVGHTYDARTLRPGEGWRYRGEGWGLTTVGDELVQSDGTATLRILDPASLTVTREIRVRLRGRAVTGLNELEDMGDGTVWANIWPTDRVVVIDLASGAVVATLDLSQLKARQPAGAETNGIARNTAAGTVHVTGKYWNAVYELRVRPSP